MGLGHGTSLEKKTARGKSENGDGPGKRRITLKRKHEIRSTKFESETGLKALQLVVVQQDELGANRARGERLGAGS
jgi:hypothetical protein